MKQKRIRVMNSCELKVKSKCWDSFVPRSNHNVYYTIKALSWSIVYSQIDFLESIKHHLI